MAMPIAYNVRNLAVRKTTTILTVLGIAMCVAILVASAALVNGLRTVFQNTANPLQLLVLRRGINSELASALSAEECAVLASEAGLGVGPAGQPFASPEVVDVVNLPSVDEPKGMNVTVRGLSTTGIAMRPVHLLEGRWFQAGLREVVVGKVVLQRHPSAGNGKRIRFGAGDWTIVGVMDGGQSVINSEIWGDFDQIAADYNRQGSASSVLLRAEDPAAMAALKRSIEGDPRLSASAIPEAAYYETQTAAGAPLQALGILVAVTMAIGSGFAMANTMYAAVARRGREIGTLRALGFSEGAVLLSFVTESVLLALMGGILGGLLALPLNGVTTSVGNFVSFSEVAFRFRVGPGAFLGGLVFAVVLGVLGGVLPARSAAKKDILSALHEG